MPSVDIVIVNWNSGSLLAQCIESVRLYGAGLVGHCIVVDNCSKDDSALFLEGASDIILISAKQNLGFGRACNFGAAQGNSPFVLFLNPDARLLHRSLETSLAYLGSPENVNIGIAGVQLLDDNGQVQRTCAKAPIPRRLIAKSFGIATLIKGLDMQMKAWDHANTRRVDQVMGAFFFVRRDLFADLDGFDERFFVYFEEVDFSVRASQIGFSSTYLAEAQAYHKGGGVSEQVKDQRLFYSLRSRILYAFKHFSQLPAMCVCGSTLFVEPMTRFALLVVTGRWVEIGDLFRGYRMLWAWLVIEGGLKR